MTDTTTHAVTDSVLTDRTHTVSGAELFARDVEALAARAATSETNELLDAGIRLISQHTGAHGAVLYRYDGERVRVVRRLRSGWSPRPEELPIDWFPWSLGKMQPTRFLFVSDCRDLPVGPGESPALGDIGVHSCVHLPVLERTTAIGAVQLLWAEHQLAWDDHLGPTLRTLGRFMISRSIERQADLTLN
ncbi:MAG: GAF domain-containing protein [Actinomycetes bacterium]